MGESALIVPASPISPREQSETQTIRLIADEVERRGSFTTPFAEAVQRLNGICARIFKAPDPEAEPRTKAGWA